MQVNVALIKHERIKKGWSQTQLAKVIKAHPSTVSLIEAGIAHGSPKMIKAIADALGLSMEEIIFSDTAA